MKARAGGAWGQEVWRTSLGHPSYVWTAGLERRLQMVLRYVPLAGRRILDVGCGVGAFVRRLRLLSPYVWGVDVDAQRVRAGAQEVDGLALAVGEHLPFKGEVFHVVLLHEVLEHVQDDAATLRECWRVVVPGGHIVIFTPNRLYPFETHGVYLGRRYIFGNIPLVNYLPDGLRRHLVPHARAYTARSLRRLWQGLSVQVVVHTQVFPGFDHAIARWGVVGRALRRLQSLEATPLRILGLSHFVILKRTA